MPPETVIFIVPVAPPKQLTFVGVSCKLITGGDKIVMVCTFVQFTLFVIVIVYVPAARLFKSCVVAPVFHKYVYGQLPPQAETETLILPFTL